MTQSTSPTMDRLSLLLTNHLSQLPQALVPEFFQSSPPSATTGHKRRSDTAWLDGLRGVAALMVVLQHEQAMVYMGHAFCYHWPEQTSPASWPILRLAFSGGSFAVVVFFVISGYVVPRRLLRLLQEHRQAEFIEALNSAVIRRHGRLLMPAMLSALFILLFYWITGIDPNWSGGFADNFFAELWGWVKDCFQVLNYFTAFASYYNRVTWTIIIELKGSVMVFGWLFAIHSLRAQWRILLTLGLSVALVLFSSYAFYAAFFIGMMMSEIDLLHDSGEIDKIWLPWDPLSKYLRTRRLARTIVLHTTLLVALLLASFPVLKWDLPPEVAVARCSSWPSFLFNMTPPQYWDKGATSGIRDFWYFWAAWLLAVSIKELRWAKELFESSFPQYLGRHSFSLYLTHLVVGSTFSRTILILCGFGYHGGPKAKWPFNKFPVGAWSGLFPAIWGPVGWQPGVVLDLALSLPLMFWVAEIGTKVFDRPSVRMSSWMWEKWKSMR
ncbi:uncharacterized protein RHO25_007033 [Cercospora beticola]|uniref:Acyltransferase 3 domain-containing protein n=2 Tax=Cercospora beticola TaxID=122368 RepID=A0ABZ0NS77_CERBT|nr:hypothetical protein RHO25_007033 [Cercospora beticola]CAK1362713.1 unnamed protein product [Cercospora beticola]